MTRADEVTNHGNSDDTEIIPLCDIELTSFFGDTKNDGSEIFAGIKELLNSKNYFDIQKSCLQAMGLFDLGRLEKGSLLFDTRQKSFQQCWMGSTAKKDVHKQCDADGGPGGDGYILIKRDHLISLFCKRGDITTIENYRVLCPFTKYCINWYICVDDIKFVWKRVPKSVCFLVIMTQERGSSYEEAILEKSPGSHIPSQASGC